jgi:hypothetical protein
VCVCMCNTVVTLLLHCCYTVVTLLLHCCYTVVSLLSHCCMRCTRRVLRSGTCVCVCMFACLCVCVCVCACVCVCEYHCCYAFVKILLHYCFAVVTLLSEVYEKSY